MSDPEAKAPTAASLPTTTVELDDDKAFYTFGPSDDSLKPLSGSRIEQLGLGAAVAGHGALYEHLQGMKVEAPIAGQTRFVVLTTEGEMDDRELDALLDNIQRQAAEERSAMRSFLTGLAFPS